MTVGDVRRAIAGLDDSDPVFNDCEPNSPEEWTANITGIEGKTPERWKRVGNADEIPRALWIHIEIVPMDGDEDDEEDEEDDEG